MAMIVKEMFIKEQDWLRLMRKFDVRNLDAITKVFILLFCIAAAYGISFFLLKPALSPSTLFPSAGMMGPGMMNFATLASSAINIISLILALGGAAGFSFYLFHSNHEAGVSGLSVKDKHDEYRVLRKALSEDEKKIMDEIHKSGEITQDSLRFRLNWSKAKVSTHLTNLDKAGLIQRERVGKTYNVFLQKGSKGQF